MLRVGMVIALLARVCCVPSGRKNRRLTGSCKDTTKPTAEVLRGRR